MSTATLPNPVTTPPEPPPVVPAPPQRRLLTAADIAVFPSHLPTGDVRWELFDGEPLPMSPPGFRHCRIGALMIGELLVQGERQDLGLVCDDVGVILRRNPDRVIGPDAAFILTKSLPPKVTKEGYLETIPEIVVEVRSKNDTTPEVLSKVAEYHAAGVLLVWVLDSESRTVSEYRPNQPEKIYAATDSLIAADLLPGFTVPVERLFAGT